LEAGPLQIQRAELNLNALRRMRVRSKRARDLTLSSVETAAVNDPE
jgi:hypothetical protein